MNAHERLVDLLAQRSARRGEFVLSSGRTASLYIDARLTTMSPEGLAMIGPIGLETLRAAGWLVDAVGGLTLGADPIAYAISYASMLSGSPLRAFTVRKEVKAHGTGRLVEGPFQEGDRVAIVEDVITTGSSALKAASAVQAAGGEVAGILALVDREEGGRAALEAAGFEVRAIVRAEEIVARMPRTTR
ncbi:MAG: orotate phosphoribosyltransferase [Anaerolineae bacterium]|nr:orotate phosphoribosyltransferase [Gemmatimonadaceae bacterium]